MQDILLIDGETVTTEKIFSIATQKTQVDIDDNKLSEVEQIRDRFEQTVSNGLPIYGVTTGYGEMVHVMVDAVHEETLQHNLIRSHAAGSGNYFSREEVRAIIACRLNALSRGCSAIRPEILIRLCELLNLDIVPAVPELGSLGASGDLNPLSHIALTLIGEGMVTSPSGERIPTSRAYEAFQLKPLSLKFKEGLALINGTSAMAGVSSLNVENAKTQLRQAEIIAALGLEVLGASASPFEESGHVIAKPHPGQIASAKNIRSLIKGSQLIESHRSLQEQLLHAKEETDSSVFLQKAYTLRCIPQILGAIRDTLSFVNDVVQREINSSNDNPLFFSEENIFHGGNFHGQHLAFTMDFLGIAMTQLGVVSERRLNRLLNRNLNNGLSEFLVWKEPGLRCGFAGAQYPATATVAENRTLCVPASVQSVPSNSDNQDVVSMGLIAARKTRQILKNNQTILAVEILASCQAVDLKGCADKLSPVGKAVHQALRSFVKPLSEDRFMTPDIEATVSWLDKGGLLSTVNNNGVELI